MDPLHEEPRDDTPGWTLIGGSLMLVLWTACEVAGLNEQMDRIGGVWVGQTDRAQLSLDLEEVAGHLQGHFSGEVRHREDGEPTTFEGPLEGRVDGQSRVHLRFGQEERPDGQFVGVLIGKAPALSGTWQSPQGAIDLTLRPEND